MKQDSRLPGGMEFSRNRRHFLKATGSTGITAILAGCPGKNGETDSTDDTKGRADDPIEPDNLHGYGLGYGQQYGQ